MAAADSSGYADLGTARFLAEEVKAAEELRHERVLAGIEDIAGEGDGQLNGPHQIALDSNDNVIVADAGNHRIQAISSTGAYICKIGSEGTGDGMFNYPFGVAIDKRSGLVYVSDTFNHRIQALELAITGEPSAAFRHVRTFGSEGSGPHQVRYPQHIAISERDSRIYVADASNNRVQVFTSAGDHVKTIVTDQFQYPFGIAVDENDVVYVADYRAHCVFVLSSEDGSLVRTIGSAGQSAGQFTRLTCVCVDQHRGHVIVGDMNGMQVFNKEDGSFLRRLGDKRFHTTGAAVDSEGRIVASSYSGQTIERWA